MLENENGTPADLPQPPAPRRRSARRPAGAPSEVVAPTEVAASTDAPQTAAAQPDPGAAAPEVTEAPKRTRRATRPAAATSETPAVEAATPAASETEAPAKAKRAPARSRAKAAPVAEEAPATQDFVTSGADGEAPAEKPKRTRRSPRAAAPDTAAENAPVPDSTSTAAAEESAGSATEEKPVTRRRRAATRPAAAPETAAPAAPTQAPATAAATASVPVEEITQQSVESEAPAAAPTRRRRAATRPAAAPDAKPTVPQTETPVTAAASVSTPVGTTTPQSVESDAPVEAPTRRRRAATRPASAPDARPAESEAAPSAAEAAPEQSEPQDQGRRSGARSRRSSREAASATSDAGAGDSGNDVAAALDALTADIASSRGAQSSEEATAAADEKPTSRRRRSSRGAAAPAAPAAEEVDTEDSTEEPMDGITAALKMAENDARSRRALVSDPFRVTAENRKAHLDELTQSIATGDTTEEFDEDEDEDDETVADGSAETADENDDSDDNDSDDDSSEDDSDSDDSSDDNQDSDGEGGGNRRRRRRGGRRRRRGGSNNRDDQSTGDSDSSDDDDSGDENNDAPVEEKKASGRNDATSQVDADSSDDSDNDDDSGTTRRRRRRRRSGNDLSDSSSRSTGDDAITGIEGSTRMEAKRQRRKENRTAGRRRAPILSEAEFLARREAVDRKLVIRQGEEYTQLAVVEDGILVEHYVDRASAMSLIGNVYLAKVQNVLPSMEAAFLDIGRGRNAVLYAGEVDWSGFDVSAHDRRVEKVFKSGQTVLVQVTKDPVGAKGARLTGHISLPGRYVVYSPGGHLSGISRKLPDFERARLREILGELIGDDESVIVRTAAEGASSEELVRDVNRLKAQWEIIEKKSKQGSSPASLYSEPDLTLRIVRDLFTEDFGALVVQGNGGADDSFDEINAYVAHVAPSLADRVQHFNVEEKGHDAFAEYRIDEQIAKALDRKVHLPSGGSLVIDRTEAMTVIDVNTGRFTGAGGNLETTVTSNNLEAAEEVVRQLRLRDIGGIIVVDFIDMVLPSNRDLLLRRLVECLGRDRTRHQVAEVTSLGLIQLTRKKIGTGLAEAFTEECEHCHGDGYLRFHEPVDSQAPSDGGDRRGGGGSGSGSNSGGGSSNGNGSGSGGGGNRGRGGRNRRGGNGGGDKKSD